VDKVTKPFITNTVPSRLSVRATTFRSMSFSPGSTTSIGIGFRHTKHANSRYAAIPTRAAALAARYFACRQVDDPPVARRKVTLNLLLDEGMAITRNLQVDAPGHTGLKIGFRPYFSLKIAGGYGASVAAPLPDLGGKTTAARCLGRRVAVTRSSSEIAPGRVDERSTTEVCSDFGSELASSNRPVDSSSRRHQE
jgi:hypothetical protein